MAEGGPCLKTLNVIGCGKVGRTLARLWTDHNVLQVQSIVNASLESGLQAAEFVGAGQPVESLDSLGPSDFVMIATSDEVIGGCCRQLCDAGIIGPGVVIFHVSGSLPSALLEPAKKLGAAVASVHPVKTFADPAASAGTFAGTYCAIEGDTEAREALSSIFEQIGGIPFAIRPDAKAIYHAGTVLVCNYLVALIEAGLSCFERADVPRDLALKIIEPIVRGTVDNVFALGPVRALTGPMARGEPSVVQKHIEDLSRADDLLNAIYRDLGQVAVELSQRQGTASEDALAKIVEILG
jgi:predicted short-subunit dehydrogenase-like oxidoreductase (DUF2520 family)